MSDGAVQVEVTTPAPGAQALADALAATVTGFGLSGRVSVVEDDEGTLVASVQGEGLEALIGRGGEVINALQLLGGQIARRAQGGARTHVLVDVGDYRARRAASLEGLAHRAAKEVLSSGDEIELDPMTPQERRVIHLVLKEYPGVATRSEGEDPHRRIIVEPIDPT